LYLYETSFYQISPIRSKYQHVNYFEEFQQNIHPEN
jgi:hypothetical protein